MIYMYIILLMVTVYSHLLLILGLREFCGCTGIRGMIEAEKKFFLGGILSIILDSWLFYSLYNNSFNFTHSLSVIIYIVLGLLILILFSMMVVRAFNSWASSRPNYWK